ncbi:hypothetical protein A3733_20890 [Pseudoalteromonas shioyasakiensis]|nr:hypothetical protein A3733_20890 [Pseudoalteromonas shioyasakiensis]
MKIGYGVFELTHKWNSEHIMEDLQNKRSFSQRFFGEYASTPKVLWTMSICIIAFLWLTREGGLFDMLIAGDFNSAFLLTIIGYLSEFRYRIIKESRND